jgi:hypothetical protein
LLRVGDPRRVDPGLDELDDAAGDARLVHGLKIALAAVEHDAQRRRLLGQLAELRGGHDEAVDDPGVVARTHRAVGRDRVRHVHRRRREQRRVVDQRTEQLSPRVVRHAGGIALRLAGHSRALLS